jgi:hypothetical protein
MVKKLNQRELNASLTLIVKPPDDPEKPVDAQLFLETATKWLHALATFAVEQGRQVRWEIADLQRSSAVVEVLPVDVVTGVIASDLAENWESAIRSIEQQAAPPASITPKAIRAIGEFVNAVSDLSVAIKTGGEPTPHQISPVTQKRFLDATAALPPEEYALKGTVRGRLAVLNSWNPKERWFRLQLPLAPDKHVKCVYTDEMLIEELGETFEDLLEVTGTLHYHFDDPWPSHVEVDHVRPLPKQPAMSLDQLIGSLKLPRGLDSVTYVRSLRDAE